MKNVTVTRSGHFAYGCTQITFPAGPRITMSVQRPHLSRSLTLGAGLNDYVKNVISELK
jgi:hypothetical protein